MTHASLFSGIGGFDYAAALLGWINIFDCEIDAFCRKVLEYHFPNSVHYGDITKQIFKEWRGKIDVLSGGFPCQPFSLAGQRKGADDNRYLWPEMLRVIREIRPTWVVGENVAGILTMVQPGAEVEVGGQASLFGEDYRKRVLRYLRNNPKLASSSLGQKYKEQYRGELTDTLSELSHEIALATKKIIEECEKTSLRVRQESVSLRKRNSAAGSL